MNCRPLDIIDTVYRTYQRTYPEGGLAGGPDDPPCTWPYPIDAKMTRPVIYRYRDTYLYGYRYRYRYVCVDHSAVER